MVKPGRGISTLRLQTRIDACAQASELASAGRAGASAVAGSAMSLPIKNSCSKCSGLRHLRVSKTRRSTDGR
jgi:hypothetical protein